MAQYDSLLEQLKTTPVREYDRRAKPLLMAARRPKSRAAPSPHWISSTDDTKEDTFIGAEHLWDMTKQAFGDSAPEAPEIPELEFPEEREDVRLLEEILETLPEYAGKHVQVQRIFHRHHSRVPQSVVTFTYFGNLGPQLGQLYIKQYSNPELRKKDTVLPLFCKDIGIPSIEIVGYEPEKGEYLHEHALFLPQFPLDNALHNTFSVHTGAADLISLVEVCAPNYFVKFPVAKALDLLIDFAVKGYRHRNLLEKKYGFALGRKGYETILHERFLQFLQDGRKAEAVHDAYTCLCASMPEVPLLFSHGDATGNNFRVGNSLTDLYLLDFELSGSGIPATADAAMLVLSLAAKMENRDAAYDEIKEHLIPYFIRRFNNAVKGEGLAELVTSEEHLRQSLFQQELLGHFWKIGDQVWLADRDGPDAHRREKATWHLSKAAGIADLLLQSQDGTMKKHVRNFFNATLDLLASHGKTCYLSSLAGSYRMRAK